jgi:hypothetical protein
MDIQALKATSLEVTGTVTFDNLPISSKTPVNDNQLTTKIYVDGTISNADSARKSYMDDNRITSTDSNQKPTLIMLILF